MTYLYLFILIYVLSIPLALKRIHSVIEESKQTDITKDIMHSYGGILAFLPILNTVWSIAQLLDTIIQNRRRRYLEKASKILQDLRNSVGDEGLKSELDKLIDEIQKLDN
jgi:phosphomevalonate kinase